MKQKVVIKVQMTCEKCRTKARQIAAETNGVSSLAIEEVDKDQVVVTGDGIASANLTRAIRKEVGFAAILGVQEVQETTEASSVNVPTINCQYFQNPTPTYQVVYI